MVHLHGGLGPELALPLTRINKVMGQKICSQIKVDVGSQRQPESLGCFNVQWKTSPTRIFLPRAPQWRGQFYRIFSCFLPLIPHGFLFLI